MDMESSKRKQTGAEERPRSGKRRFLLLFLSGLLVLSLLLLCAAKRGATLRVAVYPYVPDRIRFQQAVEAQWAARHPEVQLDFVPWDGYAEDPPEDLDVFVYDAVFFYDFLEKGYLLPIPDGEIRDIEDFIPCALAACRVDGTAYALPQLLCTNLLYTRKGDVELSGVKNLSELYRIIGDSPQSSGPSSVGEGLLLSIPDELSAALWYLEIRTDLEQDFSEWVSIPEAGNFDPDVTEVLVKLQTMAGARQTEAGSAGGEGRSCESWFAEGYGRAFIGFSESMYALGAAADDVAFHKFSLSEDDDVPLMYADVASVNAGIAEEKRALALELLDVVTGREALVAASAPAQAGQSPQYLLLARGSAYDELAKEYPVYRELKAVVSDPACRVFVVRPSGRKLVEQASVAFQKALAGEPAD